MNIHEVLGKKVTLEWIVEDGQKLCIARLADNACFMADGASEAAALADMAEALQETKAGVLLAKITEAHL